MTQASIRVGIFKPGAEVEFTDIQETLETLQQIVGGYIEIVPISMDDLLVTCNEEGKLMGLPFNRTIGGSRGRTDDLVGTFLVSRRSSENDDLASLTADDEDKLRAWKPGSMWNVRTGAAVPSAD